MPYARGDTQAETQFSRRPSTRNQPRTVGLKPSRLVDESVPPAFGRSFCRFAALHERRKDLRSAAARICPLRSHDLPVAAIRQDVALCLDKLKLERADRLSVPHSI